jgi:hypothetical protein
MTEGIPGIPIGNGAEMFKVRMTAAVLKERGYFAKTRYTPE